MMKSPESPVKNCTNCYYNAKYDWGRGCTALSEIIKDDCFAWADKEEGMRREQAIKSYKDKVRKGEIKVCQI